MATVKVTTRAVPDMLEMRWGFPTAADMFRAGSSAVQYPMIKMPDYDEESNSIQFAPTREGYLAAKSAMEGLGGVALPPAFAGFELQREGQDLDPTLVASVKTLRRMLMLLSRLSSHAHAIRVLDALETIEDAIETVAEHINEVLPDGEGYLIRHGKEWRIEMFEPDDWQGG